MKILRLLWPRKLFTRTLLLVSTIMILSYFAAIILFISYVKKFATNDLAAYLGREIESTRLALDMLPAQKRIPYLSSLMKNNRVYLQVDSQPGTAPGIRADIPLLRLLAQRLSDKNGIQPELRVEPRLKHNIIWIKLVNVTPGYWYGVWLNKNKDQFSPRFIVQIVLILFLSGLVVLWISYRLNKPFKGLTRAAKQITKGEIPELVAVSGVKETRQLCVAFNTMGKAISQFEADRALMLAGISHDLRTPLSRMRLAVEMIDNKNEQDLQQGIIQDLDEMDAIVGQFLTYVEKNTNEQDVRTDLSVFLSKIAERYIQQGYHVVVESESGLLVGIKPVSLQRIINNLIDNAIRYAKPPVIIKTDSLADKLSICVMDNGPGIPQKDMQRLCQPFTRKNHSRSDVSGAGLGLAIVQRIAKANSIEVILENREQGGLSVCIKFCNSENGFIASD